VFVADPALGFPPGTLDGIPDQLSWHGILHAIAPPLAFLSLIAACFVLARRFAALLRRGWAAYCAATGVALLGIMAWPDNDTVGVQLVVAVVLGFAWVSTLGARLLTELPDVTGSIKAEEHR
jgi:Protein of unknown function (DUF998)